MTYVNDSVLAGGKADAGGKYNGEWANDKRSGQVGTISLLLI